MQTLSFKHSGDMGDIVAGLATVKEICERREAMAQIYLDTSGGKDDPLILRQSRGGGLKFNDAAFQFLKPLLEEQPYVAFVGKWQKGIAVDYDLNAFRAVFFDKNLLRTTNQNLLFAHQVVFGLDMGYKGPWLKWPSVKQTRSLLAARSNRYHSSDQVYLIHRFELANERNGFMGTDLEYNAFQDCIQHKVPRVAVKNALDAANEIAASKRFIVNGTLFYWIAVGIGHEDIVHEMGVDIPTTLFPYCEKMGIKTFQGLHSIEAKLIDEEKTDEEKTNS